MAVLGHPRNTGDLDIFIEQTSQNIERVARALRAFGFESLAAQAPAAFAITGSFLVIGREPVQINITNNIDGISFAEAWDDRVTRKVFKRKVAFLGRDTFIKNKRASAQNPRRGKKRFVDLADIAVLEED